MSRSQHRVGRRPRSCNSLEARRRPTPTVSHGWRSVTVRRDDLSSLGAFARSRSRVMVASEGGGVVSVLRVRGVSIRDGEPVDLYADGDRWTTDPVPNAELVAEGWLLPGLVDAHTHPGAEMPGQPVDPAVLREDLRAHLASGVTLIRAPGLVEDPPDWFGVADDSPRAVHAGPWIAQPGQFFEGWGR